MQIRRKIKFILHRRHPGQTTGLGIRMRVTMHAQPPVDFPTGININQSEWDESNCHANASCLHASSTNALIDEWRAKINDVFALYELVEKRMPTTAEIKTAFNAAIGRDKPSAKPATDKMTLVRVLDMFTKNVGVQNNWTSATYKKFATTRKYFQKCLPGITLDELDDASLVKIMNRMIAQDKRNSTISKQFFFIRWFLRWANGHGYYNGKLHETFKPKLKGIDGHSKEIIYLTRDELQKVEQQTFTPKQAHLEQTRDVFVFCCYTGLRYSDVAKLRRSDVKDDHINVVTQKTTDALTIELNNHSRAILDKYASFHFPHDIALPVISNQKMNDNLKDIGKMCGFDYIVRIVYYVGNKRVELESPKWSLLTTHCARRTFVVMALQLGIAADVIMKWTGHSSYATMKPYIAIVDELKVQSMEKFNAI